MIKTSSQSGGYIWKRPSDDKERVVKLKKSKREYKKVKQFSMDGVFIKEYSSLYEAKEKIPGFQRKAPLTGFSSGGYRWKYSTDPTPLAPLTKRTYSHRQKKVDQFNLSMDLIGNHESITAARIQVPGANISWSVKHSKPSKGFNWKYA